MDESLLEFPNDDNGDVLRRLQRDGDDLSKSRDVDFTVVFSDQASANHFAKHFEKRGYKVSVEESGCVTQLPWDVLVVNHMVPSHDVITDFEEELQAIADGFGGRNDGWGCIAQNAALWAN